MTDVLAQPFTDGDPRLQARSEAQAPPGGLVDGLMVRALPPTPEERLLASCLEVAERLARMAQPVDAGAILRLAPHLPEREVYALAGSPKFQAALRARGLEAPGDGGLWPRQRHALAVYFGAPRGSHTTRLRAAGVSAQEWTGWLAQPAFQRALRDASEGVLEQAVPVALQRIAQKVDDGDLQAIQLALEMTGRHDRRERGFDPRALVMELFSILDEEGADQALLGRVAQRLRARLGMEAASAPAQVVQLAAPAGAVDSGS